MKIYHLYVAAWATLLPFAALTQAKTASQTNAAPHQSKSYSTQKLNAQSDSLKSAAADVKSSFANAKVSLATLFPNRKDTIAIAISSIEYDDAGLVLLKEDLKKMKGVKSVLMQYKGGAAMLEIPFKGSATDLWDKLPPDAKAPFKLLEAGDNNISLENKAAKMAHQ
jgi:hypothetical protein